MENNRQGIELADIFREHANKFSQEDTLCPIQLKAFQAIMQCRTAALGGHLQKCDKCEYTLQAYNSCRNRHCPKCQFVKKAQWVDKLAGNLPPVKYFHLVFTIPVCLHKLFYINQKAAYGLLFKAAGKTLLQCAENTKYLGAKPGAVGILHTWGQTLVYHPHIHMIVPAGGLSEDGSEWIRSSKRFFLPVKALSYVFRGMLCKFIEGAAAKNKIKLPEDQPDFNAIKKACYRHNWVVYCERPFSCPDNLIGYLGNYTHRVAISNQRIVKYENGYVSFRYKDYRVAGIRKVVTLKADEFIRRFLQHILPSGFSKIRYFGFLSLRNIKAQVEQCINLLDKDIFLPVLEGLTSQEVSSRITGIDLLCCPKCKTGKMTVIPLNESG